MNKRIQHHALSACALAATLFLAACGGGSSTDATPPTVAITSAAGTGSNVLFSFAFSEALATGTFTVDDIVVTGGTAGAFTMVDSSHATLVVTPTSGALSAFVAANKFDDVAHNFNTVAASNTYAVPTINFESAVYFDAFEGLVSAAIADDPVLGASNKVAKFVKGTSGQPWSGATIYTAGTPPGAITLPAVDLGASKTVTLRSYTSAAVGTIVSLKFENAAAAGENIAAETVTTVQNAWETLTFNFNTPTTGVYNPAATYNKASIFPAFSIPVGAASFHLTADTNFYFDDLKYAVVAGSTPTPNPNPTPTPSPTTTVLATFDEATPPAFVGFNGAAGGLLDAGSTGIAAGPSGGSGNALKVTRMGGDPWAGAKLTGLTLNVSSVNNTFSARVYSPLAGKPVTLKLEGNGATSEMAAQEAVVVGWQTLTWVVPAGDIGPVRSDVVFLPNLGTVGTGESYYFDDLKLGPAGAASSTATLAFSSGYTDPIAKTAAGGGTFYEGATAEGGAWGYYSDGFATAGNAFTGGAATYRYIGTDSTAAPTLGSAGTYMGIYNLYKSGGLALSGQTSVTIELAADADYIASGKDVLRVDVVGSELFNNGAVADCQIVASGTVKPTSTTLTAYKIPLTTFGQGCNQSSITTVANVLTHPVGKVSVTADWPNINTTTATSGGHYITAFTIGNITFTP